jgi:hypothetical protein
VQLINKMVFVVSFVGNNGTFIMGYKAMVMDVEFIYHLAYVLTSTLGLCVHELFYSILVGDAQPPPCSPDPQTCDLCVCELGVCDPCVFDPACV